jgi:hypothetical protein
MGTEGSLGRVTFSAGNELDRFSRPATRRARPGLPWVPSSQSMPRAEIEKRVSES